MFSSKDVIELPKFKSQDEKDEYYTAEAEYEDLKGRVKECEDRGKDPGGWGRDLNSAATRFRNAGGRP